RLIVVGSAYDEALARLAPAVSSLVVGPPHHAATFVPAVSSAAAKKKIDGYIEAGKRTARLLVQGDTPAGGHYVAPTVFVDVKVDDPCALDEILVPVHSVFHARSFDEAVELAMDSEFALTGGLYSRNPRN